MTSGMQALLHARPEIAFFFLPSLGTVIVVLLA